MVVIHDRPRRSYKFPAIVSILIILIISQYYFYRKYRNEIKGSDHLSHKYRNNISESSSPLCPYSYKITDKRIIFDNPSYSINHYPEFVCPQNFRNMADWIYGWPETIFNEQVQNSVNKIRETVAYLPHGSIIYIKTDSLPEFFSDIYPHFRNKFVLITGQGDIESPGRHLHHLEKADSKIIQWFGQNANINASTSSRFTPIPIGLNCFEMAEGIRGVHQQYLNSTLPSVLNKSVGEPSRYIQPFDITQRVLQDKGQSNKIALLNFSPDTDPSGVRRKLWKDICENNKSSFGICFTKPGGVDISSLPAVYKRNRQYPLWLSPRGNGIDCHRTWEAFYLDAIPILWHSTLDSIYTNLPVIIINDWSEINEKFLRDKLYEISLKKVQQPPVYQYEKLRSAYWHEMILSKSRYASSNNPTQRNRCWRAKTVQ